MFYLCIIFMIFLHIPPVLLFIYYFSLYQFTLFKPKFILKEIYHAMLDNPVSFQYSLK